MAKIGAYEVHPFADAFPLLEDAEFDELVADIQRNGLRDPIVVTHDGVLIDGRNRLRACEAAGVRPHFKALRSHWGEPLILDFIVSKNLARRQLNQGQKAMLALRYEQAYAEAAKRAEEQRKTKLPILPSASNGNMTVADLPQSSPNWSGSGTSRSLGASRERAARAVGTSGRAVQQAKAVQRSAPDLAAKVQNGTLALDAAYKQVRQRERAMPKPDPAPAVPAPVLLTLHTHTGEPVSYPQPQGKATFNQTQGDGISWARWSWNPVTGCLHGCGYCYAREIATSERYKQSYPAGFTPLLHHERLDAPANTTIPAAHRDDPAWRRVFVCSMADLYGRWVPDEWIAKVHQAMLASPQWQYILLTKFPARYVGLDLPPGAWVGTSVDEQKRVRIAEDAFRQLGGVRVKWLSLEPLREPLEFNDLSMFDWVVIGAQTTTHQPTGVVEAFEPPAEWVVRITAKALDAGCRVHWKPNLRTAPGMQWLDQYPEGERPQGAR